MRLINLAPQSAYLAMDGGGKRPWHLYEGMILQGATGKFVGRNFTAENSSPIQQFSPEYSWRDYKVIAALAALVTGKDYWQLKMISPKIRRTVGEAVQKPYDVIIVNCLYSVTLLGSVPKPYRLLVDTQNYDPACFHAMVDKSHNPLLKCLCRRAARLSEQVLQKLPFGTVLIHVSERDASMYQVHRPDLKHIVVENGTMIKRRAIAPDYALNGKKILLFVGSLSAKMNQDALQYFATRFWPHLQNNAEFRVVGSNPPAHIQKLCSTPGWKLYANVSEDQLQRLYAEAHFATLPFAYGEGSKLKLFEACGRGVPVISTPFGVVGIKQLPPLVTISDDPKVWLQLLIETRGLADQAVDQTILFADEFSWSKLAGKMLNAAKECSLIR